MIYIFSIISCAAIILFLSKIAFFFKLIDYPSHRKLHIGNIPLIGGIAIYLNILFYAYFLNIDFQLAIIFLSSCIILVLGVIDDAIELGVTIRLISQFIASLLILGSGLWIVDIGDYYFLNTINIGIFGILLTFLCVIGLTNAINFIDGIDGLCASTVLVALCTLILYSFFFGYFENFNFIITLILSLFIFLVFNLGFIKGHKVFLGDSGSTVLGFLLSWILIYYSHPSHRVIHPVLTIWCVVLPIYDILGVIMRRILNRTNPFKPDRLHIHHLLIDLRIDSKIVFLILFLISVLFSILGGFIFYYLGSLSNILFFILFFILYNLFIVILSKKFIKSI